MIFPFAVLCIGLGLVLLGIAGLIRNRAAGAEDTNKGQSVLLCTAIIILILIIIGLSFSVNTPLPSGTTIRLNSGFTSVAP